MAACTMHCSYVTAHGPRRSAHQFQSLTVTEAEALQGPVDNRAATACRGETLVKLEEKQVR